MLNSTSRLGSQTARSTSLHHTIEAAAPLVAALQHTMRDERFSSEGDHPEDPMHLAFNEFLRLRANREMAQYISIASGSLPDLRTNLRTNA